MVSYRLLLFVVVLPLHVDDLLAGRDANSLRVARQLAILDCLRRHSRCRCFIIARIFIRKKKELTKKKKRKPVATGAADCCDIATF
jgi:hypothetical protein